MLTRARAKKLNSLNNNGEKILQSCQDRNPFDIPLEKSGRLEDQLFVDSIRFSNNEDLNLEGLTYEEIESQPSLKMYLQGLKGNLLGYFNMTPKQKANFFKKRDLNYIQSLNMKEQKESLMLDNSDEQEKPKRKAVSFSGQEGFIIFDKEERPGIISATRQLHGQMKNSEK